MLIPAFLSTSRKGDRIYHQLKKLGSSLDWNRACFTMDPVSRNRGGSRGWGRSRKLPTEESICPGPSPRRWPTHRKPLGLSCKCRFLPPVMALLCYLSPTLGAQIPSSGTWWGLTLPWSLNPQDFLH